MRLITDVIDFGDATETHLDGACDIYKLSNNTIRVELYAILRATFSHSP
jgi:hypothetical protein